MYVFMYPCVCMYVCMEEVSGKVPAHSPWYRSSTAANASASPSCRRRKSARKFLDRVHDVHAQVAQPQQLTGKFAVLLMLLRRQSGLANSAVPHLSASEPGVGTALQVATPASSSMRSTYEVSMNICTEVDVLRTRRPRKAASWPSESSLVMRRRSSS